MAAACGYNQLTIARQPGHRRMVPPMFLFHGFAVRPFLFRASASKNDQWHVAEWVLAFRLYLAQAREFLAFEGVDARGDVSELRKRPGSHPFRVHRQFIAWRLVRIPR